MNKESIKQEDIKTDNPEIKPDENGGFVFSSAVKIFDPNTDEILLQIRGDD